MNEQGTERGPVAPTRPDRVIGTDQPEPGAVPAGPLSVEILAPGTVVGRFIVHRTLGMGGAGVVYAAHDPELDRTIALKILRGELADRADARARFLREAQALARLSHPNVISVYDVGADRGRVFIAMEYIAGQTLADWVGTSERSWQEVLAVLVKAGQGLAAAHAADLIHRDFKPSNLLVGVDGRVVVTDFGLARSVVEADAHGGGSEADHMSRASAFAAALTRTGAAHGTPAYMAPEQKQGRPDARADQFSFCVTLHEALFRAHPFLADESPSRSPAVPDDRAALTPGDSWGSGIAARRPDDLRGAPPWLQRAIQRGLSWKPEDRHPSMDSLLFALSREPIRRRRRVQLGLAIAVAVVGAGLAIGLAAMNEPAEPICTGAGEQLAGVWNPAASAQMRVAFAATGRPHAPASASRVAERLDAYTGQWAVMHRDTCLATARGEQSPDLLDRRMLCLSRRLAQVGAMLDLFVRHADGKLVDGAVDLVSGLEPLATCAASAALLSRVPLPVEPARRARVIELERQLDRVDLERQSGRAAPAADAARTLFEAAREVDHAPLAAEAGRLLGRLLVDLGRPDEAREALVQAERLAEEAGDVPLGAEVLLDLLGVVGVDQMRDGEAELLTHVVEATLERPELRDDQLKRARLLFTQATLAIEKGQSERGLELMREVLAIRRRKLPRLSAEVGRAEMNLGNALKDMGRFAEAREHYQEALAIAADVFGDQHPETATIEIDLGLAYHQERRLGEARHHYRIALEIFDRAAPGYRNHDMLLNNLGELESSVGDHDLARRYLEKALEMRVRKYGPDHPDVAMSLHSLGSVMHRAERFDEALEFHRRALAITEKTRGKDHVTIAYCLMSVGEDLRQLHDAAKALSYQQRALEILGGPKRDHPLVAYPLAYQGLALFDMGRHRDAVPLLERAYASLQPNDEDRARVGFALARTLEPGGPRSDRAKTLAIEALLTFTTAQIKGERRQVVAYLARAR